MLEYVKVDQEADPYSIANTIALNALVARAKSKGELLAHLKKRGVEDDVAQATIFRLQENGLINDAEFAKAWTQSRHTSKKLSKRIIAGELRTRGVDQSSIDVALDEIDDESEYRTAFFIGYEEVQHYEPARARGSDSQNSITATAKRFFFSYNCSRYSRARCSVRRAAVATTAAA